MKLSFLLFLVFSTQLSFAQKTCENSKIIALDDKGKIMEKAYLITRLDEKLTIYGELMIRHNSPASYTQTFDRVQENMAAQSTYLEELVERHEIDLPMSTWFLSDTSVAKLILKDHESLGLIEDVNFKYTCQY